MTENPDGDWIAGFVKGALSIGALLGSAIVFLIKRLGSRNGNGGAKDDNRAINEWRLKSLEERMTKLEWLDEFERREKRRLDN